MKLGRIAIFTLWIISILAAMSHAETARPSPKAIVESDTAVREASLNVAKMDYAELTLLAHYLAECSEALQRSR